MARKAHTLCQAIDLLLRGKVAESVDLCSQRVKGLEMMMNGVHYTVAQQQELLPKEGITRPNTSQVSGSGTKSPRSWSCSGRSGETLWGQVNAKPADRRLGQERGEEGRQKREARQRRSEEGRNRKSRRARGQGELERTPDLWAEAGEIDDVAMQSDVAPAGTWCSLRRWDAGWGCRATCRIEALYPLGPTSYGFKNF